MFDYMGAFLFRSGFAHVDNVITKRRSKTITWLLLSRLQDNKPHRNSPEPSETLELSGTLRNLPEVASGTYTSTQRNLPEPFGGTCLQNLHQQTPELSGTLRNLPPEPTPAHTGTLRNLQEPSSGTCSCDPHRHTPELICAEDPISLGCWGKSDVYHGLRKKVKAYCIYSLYSHSILFFEDTCSIMNISPVQKMHPALLPLNDAIAIPVRYSFAVFRSMTEQQETTTA